jgi:hypothetical protein
MALRVRRDYQIPTKALRQRLTNSATVHGQKRQKKAKIKK